MYENMNAQQFFGSLKERLKSMVEQDREDIGELVNSIISNFNRNEIQECIEDLIAICEIIEDAPIKTMSIEESIEKVAFLKNQCPLCEDGHIRKY